MRIPLIDTVAQYHSIQPEIDEAIRQVLESGQYIMGPNVAALENEIAAYLNVKEGIGVASGTDALVLALRAMDIGPGDEVIVPSYTFFATAEAVFLVGAKPVFVDIDADTFCMDVFEVDRRITNKTRALIPVHLYGHPADMVPLKDLAEANGLRIIEDNAQALGAEYRGRKTGSLADVGCLSFFPSKNLGAFGDGGMVVTNNDKFAERIRMLRSHGWRKKYYPEMVGYNSRLDEIQAAILRVKLRHLDQWVESRRALASRYNERLQGAGLGLPTEASYAKHAYHLYVIRVKEREMIQKSLADSGIASAVYYPKPVHLLKPCEHLNYVEGSFPIAEEASRETLGIPFYPELSEHQIEAVCEALHNRLVATAVP